MDTLNEEIDLVSDVQNIQKVIQKEFQRTKLNKKISKVTLPQEKKVLFNRSSGGGNVEISSPGTKVEVEGGEIIEGNFVIYLSFRDERVTISYNFLKGK